METKHQELFESNAPKIYSELPSLKTDPIIKWLLKNVFKERYLFYDKPQKTAVCSCCGAVEMPEDVKHDRQGECPKCHAKVTYRSAGIGRGKLTGRVRILIFQKKGKTVYATTNFVYADYGEGKVRLFKDVDGVFKFNRKEQQGYQTSYGYFEGGRWIEQKNIRVPHRQSDWGNAPLYLYGANLKQVFQGTDLRYCQLAEQAKEWYPKTFLKLVDLNAKYESIEKLHKVGLDHLIESKLVGEHGSAAVRWKKTNLSEILQLTKPELIKAREMKISLEGLERYKIARDCGLPVHIGNKCEYDMDVLKTLRSCQKLIEPRKLYRYIKKQEDTAAGYRLYTVAKDYNDYIKECKELELDLSDKAILLPKDLQAAHARTSAQVKVKADPEQQEQIKRKAKKLRYLGFQDGNLLIRIAETAGEIIEEGKLIGHCVGGYVDGVAAGRTNIFFVRKSSEPEEPYFTLEMKKEKGEYRMVQCRGGGRNKGNGTMPEDVKAFIDKWMAEVVNAKPKKRKKVA
ncbi:hypothetical protein Ami103574_04330 [Aminipila butyrica]|uniref:PcfJ-like protein n=1 Tax=Aminipila butyrica TaxID=433296 RepID=A0A858BUZ0_9FIRM|nr:PcfJ domain-containing protein [Aminipila butyrica]QIB68594.1 hypothetical protein Ami103574_04330 [Aminipila butyrica]